MCFITRIARIILPVILVIVFTGCRKDQAASQPSLSSQIQKIESAFKGWVVIPDPSVTSMSDAQVDAIMAFIKTVSGRKPVVAGTIVEAPGAKVQVTGSDTYLLDFGAVYDGYTVNASATIKYATASTGNNVISGASGISSQGSAQTRTVPYEGSNAQLTQTWTPQLGSVQSFAADGSQITLQWGGQVNYSYNYNGTDIKAPSQGFFFAQTVGASSLPTDPIQPP
ncbi:MAG TPA: hypothetical protein VKQ52_16890 [Puia sp.]|nr:hypothetical protein [Puia sp.]